MADTNELKELARRCRVHIVNMVYRAQAGHPGGSLSEIDLLVGLYKNTLRVRPNEPDWDDRDRFVLSKGHASPGMYAILAEMGFISEEECENSMKHITDKQMPKASGDHHPANSSGAAAPVELPAPAPEKRNIDTAER